MSFRFLYYLFYFLFLISSCSSRDSSDIMISYSEYTCYTGIIDGYQMHMCDTERTTSKNELTINYDQFLSYHWQLGTATDASWDWTIVLVYKPKINPIDRVFVLEYYFTPNYQPLAQRYFDSHLYIEMCERFNLPSQYNP